MEENQQWEKRERERERREKMQRLHIDAQADFYQTGG